MNTMEKKVITLEELVKIAASKHPDFTVTDNGIVYHAPYKDSYQMEPDDVDGILNDAKEQEIPVDEALYNFLVESMGYDTARVEGRDHLRDILENVCANYEGRGYSVMVDDEIELDADERDEVLDEAAEDFDVSIPLESYKLLFPELRKENGEEWDVDKEAYMPDTWANVD